MKRTIKIASIALAVGLLSLVSAKAEVPVDQLNIGTETSSEVDIEQVIQLEDWMIESFTKNQNETAIALEDWMLESFTENQNEIAVALEDWMLESFTENQNEIAMAVEEWMLSFS